MEIVGDISSMQLKIRAPLGRIIGVATIHAFIQAMCAMIYGIAQMEKRNKVVKVDIYRYNMKLTSRCFSRICRK